MNDVRNEDLRALKPASFRELAVYVQTSLSNPAFVGDWLGMWLITGRVLPGVALEEGNRESGGSWVRAALRHANGALRGWNEILVGDHTSRDVGLLDTDGSEWEVFSTLSEARDHVAQAYAAAVRTALLGP